MQLDGLYAKMRARQCNFGQTAMFFMKDLTTSVYDFEDLLRGNFLYVDKTEHIWRLVRPAQGMYFLSRPRRFGKSLLLSTLKAIFLGKKELFRGLAIHDKPYDWKQYPVIHLSFGDYGVVSDALGELPSYLMSKMQTLAGEHSVKLTKPTPGQHPRLQPRLHHEVLPRGLRLLQLLGQHGDAELPAGADAHTVVQP